MLDTRIDLPSAAGIQDVFRHLANDLSRTEAIAAEIESAIGQGAEGAGADRTHRTSGCNSKSADGQAAITIHAAWPPGVTANVGQASTRIPGYGTQDWELICVGLQYAEPSC